jgi:hypothetical protein
MSMNNCLFGAHNSTSKGKITIKSLDVKTTEAKISHYN